MKRKYDIEIVNSEISNQQNHLNKFLLILITKKQKKKTWIAYNFGP